MSLHHQLFLAIFLGNVPFLHAVRKTSLTAEDFRNVKRWPDIPAKADPSTEGMFEGDINLNGKTLDKYIVHQTLQYNYHKIDKRYIKSPLEHWKNGKIPYKVSSSFNPYERSRIAAAISEYHQKTCVRFVPRKKQKDYIVFIKDGGCHSMVGKVGGRQVLSLHDRCMTTGIIVHEMMHVMGFFHEQSRPDRDKYIRIKWDNIMPGNKDAFRKYNLSTTTHLGYDYDYGSIQHYGFFAFTKNYKPTIEPKQPGVVIGQRVQLSPIDIAKLNRLCKAPCDDSRPDCAFWKGSCVAQYFKTACRKTCEQCSSGAKPKCEDSTTFGTNCAALKAKQHCTAEGFNGTFMKKHCCRTCGYLSSIDK